MGCPEVQENDSKYTAVGVRGQMNLQKVPETWYVGGHQDSKDMALAKMPNSGEIELEETTSGAQTWVPVEAGDHQPIFKIFKPELFLSKGNAGTKMEERLKERPPSDCFNMGFIPCMHTKS